MADKKKVDLKKIEEKIEEIRSKGFREYEQGALEFAMMRYLEAKRMAEKYGLKNQKADLLREIGLIHGQWGNKDKEEDAYKEGLKCAENQTIRALLMTNLANRYALEKKYEESRKLLIDASKLKVGHQTIKDLIQRNIEAVENAMTGKGRIISHLEVQIKTRKKKGKR